MWWRRRSRERRRRSIQRWERIPDGDTVLAPGQRRWADLLAEHPAAGDERVPLAEPTQPLPTVRPLLTRGGWWRATGRVR